jgi:hypothetical protein
LNRFARSQWKKAAKARGFRPLVRWGTLNYIGCKERRFGTCHMVTAKLFAALASVLAICVFLTRGRALPEMNLSSAVTKGVTTIGYEPYYWQITGALVCAFLAFIYLAYARWMPLPLNQATGIVSFTFISLAFIIWLSVGYSVGMNSPPGNWKVGILFAAIFSFLFGCILFAANVAWTLLRTLRVYSSSR